LSETAVSYDFEQLEPSEPPPRDAAARELAAARLEAEQIRAQAHAQGLAAGRAEGLEQGRVEAASAAEALHEALRGIGEIRDQAAESLERDAIELALTLAGKIVLATLQVRPELVVEVVQGALRRVAGQRTISILVNPADLETVRAALGDLQGQSAAVEHWDLQPDARVPAGGAVIRTAEGEVDATVQTQLERAGEVVLAELGPRRERSR
jgi:flagellar assembly protein FliH